MQQINILVIEQSRNNPYFLLNQMTDSPATLVFTYNENEAATALNNPFDFILLDSAYATTKFVNFVKRPDSPNGTTPIITMLEPFDSRLKTHFIGLGFDDCLIKPLTDELLDQLINRPKINDNLMSIDYIQTLLIKTYNNKNLVLTIFKKLFAELPQQIVDIRQALQTQQYQAALEITHKLHGSLSFCGFTDIQQYAYNLENCLVQKDYQSVRGYFSALTSAILNFTAKENVILNDIKQSLD